MIEEYKLVKVSAFAGTETRLKGSLAAVGLLTHWPPISRLQEIAHKVGLPETAFLVPGPLNGFFDLRWFTPEIEMDLCGHATLAAAFVLFNQLGSHQTKITFNTVSGNLTAFNQSKMINLDFPARIPTIEPLPDIILKGIGKPPLIVLKSRDYLLIYSSQKDVEDITPDPSILNQINLDPGGIIVSAKGDSVDFVSRYFTPQASIFEDPVTGSAHCSLVPYWSQVLRKKKLVAQQLSERGGQLFCEDLKERVTIGGYCVSEGGISILV